MIDSNDKKTRKKVAVFTAGAFLILSYFLFITSLRLGSGYNNYGLVHLVLILHLLYNPLIILAFLSCGFTGGIITVILSSVFGLLVAPIAGSDLYRLPPTSFLVTALISYILIRSERDFEWKGNIENGDLETEYNMLKEEQVKEESEKEGWRKRMLKYSILREITESLSSSLSLEEILHLVTDSALYIIGKGEAALLFLVEKGELALKATSYLGDSAAASSLRIKSKSGDEFDSWVFKMRQNLIVTNGDKDFRFSRGGGERKIMSLISSPILRGKEIKGILRLDSSSPDEYAADDLRLLDVVASLTSLSMENAELYQRTEELAIRDNLTGLYVHKYFQDRLEEELKRALIQNYPLSLIMLDVDYFKNYNDRFGHIAGDIVLCDLAKILTDETPPGNLIARYGGEEFCLILPRNHKEEASRLAEKICRKVSEHTVTLRRIETKVTISLGVATLPRDARTKTELIKKADEALYRAKKGGKNQVCI